MTFIINPYVFGGAAGGGGDAFAGRLYEEFYWPGRTQEPGSSLSVNKASSLAEGLVFLALPGGSRRNDLISGGAVTVSKETDWYVTGNALRYGYGKGADDNWAYYPWAPVIGSITTQCTIVVFLSVSSLSSSFAELLCIPYRDGSWSSPFGAMEFLRNSTGSECNFTYANAGSQVAVTSDSSMIAADGILRQYAVTRDGSTVKFYRDGVQHGATKTLGSNGNTDFNGGHPVTLGNRSPSSSGNSMGGWYTMAGLWNRALSPHEIALLNLKPLILVKPTY